MSDQALEGHERIDSDFAATIRDQAERFSREMSDLKQAMSTVYGGWESSRRAEDVTIQELGNLEGLQRVQEETFEVAEVVKAATLEFKVQKSLVCASLVPRLHPSLREKWVWPIMT